MALLEVKSLERACVGVIINSQGLKMAIQVIKPKGLMSFIIKADGKANGLSACTAGDAWQKVIAYYGITKTREPVVKKKLKNRLLSRKV